MSSDGHAFIGILTFNDGTCINVSLPNSESRELYRKPARVRTVTGRTYPFVFADEEIRVGGRKVGLGRCGPYYIFVPWNQTCGQGRL